MSFNIPFKQGAVFKPSFDSATIHVASGATGTYVTLTPPAGKRARLIGLASVGTDQTANLTTVAVGGVDIISGVTLSRTQNEAGANNEYQMGYSTSNVGFLTGGIDEIIEIKTDIATTFTTAYHYQFGDFE